MILDCHNNYMQMQSALLNLADQVVNGKERGPQANLHFRSIINEVRNLDQCLLCLKHSDNFAFVYCTNMIKLIQSGEFCIISETKSEQNVLSLLDNLNNTKVKVYGHIISELVSVILYSNKSSYLSKSIKDLIAICLKALFQDSSFFSYLQKFINFFLPYYQFIESFNTPTQTILSLIEPRYNLDYNLLKNYSILLQILSSMFEFVTVQTSSKSYYEYRRSIYVFRNAYLAHFLHFAVQNWKILFLNKNESLRGVMKLTIEFMQHVFLYPFTLSLHEFQLQQDCNDNISNGSNDLYFPNFFRHAICDVAFLQSIQEYTYLVINNQQTYIQKRNQLNSLVKILGRSCCPSQYTFKNDEEKQYCREFSITIIKRLSENYRYSETYYLNTIMDIFYKMLTIYDFYFSANRSMIIYSMLQFLFRVMQQAQIKIDEGKRSPFARTFELLSISLEYSKDRLDKEFVNNVKFTSQKILQKAFERLLSPQANDIMQRFGFNQPTEIQCFCQMYEFVGAVFQSSLQTNLKIMQNVNLSILTPGSIVIWLHLCAQLIPKTTANLHQTTIILKYYQLAKNGNTLASLRYIRTFVEEVMSQFNEDLPSNPLWTNIQQLTPVSFQNLIMSVIAICVNNFKDNTNNEVLDYSLEFFKTIYITLKKFDSKAFVQFYNIVEQLLRGIQQTVFANPKYFSKRQDFFNVISIIWINSDNLEFVYKIDNIIKNSLHSHSAQAFFQYLHDITGLIEPLDHHQAFEVLTELALDELTKQFAIHLNNQVQTTRFFKESYFMKIFCRLVYALISDINRKLFFQTHTKIPLRIHKLIFPYIKFITQSEDYEYPKNFANILERMVNLNPLSQIVNFSGIMKTLKQQPSEHFDRLVRMYFEHIHRVQDINWMYDLIGGNPDYMANWWQEAMLRNLHPKVNFKVIAESRFWINNRQKETFARLLFELGYYDREYWNVDGFESERTFLQEFSKIYS